MKNKNKVWNILLIISFLPFLWLMARSIHAYINGCAGGLLNQVSLYGFDAFQETFFWELIGLTILPILPAALIYQIIYLVRLIRMKKQKAKNRLQTQSIRSGYQ